MTHHVHGLDRSLIRGMFAIAIVAAPASAQTPLFRVERNDATRLMQLNDDAGLVVLGASGMGTIPAEGAGIRFMWYPGKAALRAGQADGTEWDDTNIGVGSVGFGEANIVTGQNSLATGLANTVAGGNSIASGNSSKALGGNSVAMGNLVTASGFYAVAMGSGTQAMADASTALGQGTVADGAHATAMGEDTEASGVASTALGRETKALGLSSTAMGFKTTAVGSATTAMGTNAAAFGNGSFAFGDASSTGVISALDNQFVARAAGGFRFRTNPGLDTGCDLPAGSGAFACTSSRRAKEGFTDMDGESVLTKLAAIPIQRWNYIGTGSAHVGPVAEDFFAAFGLGEGATTISTVDADGINMLAVQALERRTDGLREENAALRADNAALHEALSELRAEVRTLVADRGR